MYPSSQSAASMGLHAAAAAAASLGALPVSIAQQQASSIYSGASGGGILTTAADARVTPYNWQAAMSLAASGSGLFGDHQGGLGPKIHQDSSDKRPPSVQRVVHHSSSSSGGAHVSDSSSAANRFQPYRGSAAAGDGLLTSGNSGVGMSGSQFAAFDSMYKACQSAFTQGAGAAGLFNPQSLRFEDQLLTEQQLMLQASLLQYPHFSVFPGAAAAAAAATSGLYPGLAAGIRFPQNDYYAAAAAQSMPPGLLLPSMKFPNVSSSNWLGLDRMSGVSTSASTSDRDVKDGRGDRHSSSSGSAVPKESETIPRRTHDRGRDERGRDKLSDHSHQTSNQDDSSRRDYSTRRPSDLELQQQQRQERRHSASQHHSRPSPMKEDSSRHNRASDFHQHHSSHLSDGMNKQSSHHPVNSHKSERQHVNATTHALSSEPLNLNKLLGPSDVGASSSHSRPSGRQQENSWERQFLHQQDRDPQVKDVRLPASHRNEPESTGRVDKMKPLTLTIPPRPGIPVSAQLHHEQKFHRPFEMPSRSDTTNVSNKVKTSKVASVATSVDSKPSFVITSERNGVSAADIRNRQAASQVVSSVTVGSRSTAGDELPLNLVCRHGESQQKHHQPQQRVSSVTNKLEPSKPVAQLPKTELVVSRGIVPCGGTRSDSVRRHRTHHVKSEHRPHPVVSKLDLKASKRAERRKPSALGSVPSSDEDEDYESDSNEDEKRCARLLLIASGPPLKHDASPTKRKFLEQFGLLSYDVYEDIEFEKRRKRRRLFRERSVSPVIVDDEHCVPSTPLKQLTTDTSRRVDLVENSQDIQLKALFLCKFNLQPTDLALKQKLNLMRSTGEAEQKRSFDAVCSHITKRMSIRCWPAEVSTSNHRSPRHSVQTQAASTNRCGSSSKASHSNERLYSNYTQRGRDGWLPANRQRGNTGTSADNNDGRLCLSVPDTGQVQNDGSHVAFTSNALDLSSDSSSDHRTGATSTFADFSSPQSSSICMAGIESSTPAYGISKSARLPDGSRIDAAVTRDSRTFQWPGIDAVMESYQLHLEEQVMERQLLTEQCQRLKHQHADLTRNAEKLATIMSEMLQGRQQLSDERSRAQAAIDGLKKSFRLQR